MKKILVIFILLFYNTFTFGQSGPKIQFTVKDNTIDYGTIKKGVDNGIRIFEFKNTGDQPLIIENVKSTCGCLVPTKPSGPILPGKKSEIVIKYSMSIGKISKTITVDSNAVNYENGTVGLKIKGEVLEK